MEPLEEQEPGIVELQGLRPFLVFLMGFRGLSADDMDAEEDERKETDDEAYEAADEERDNHLWRGIMWGMNDSEDWEIEDWEEVYTHSPSYEYASTG